MVPFYSNISAASKRVFCLEHEKFKLVLNEIGQPSAFPRPVRYISRPIFCVGIQKRLCVWMQVDYITLLKTRIAQAMKSVTPGMTYDKVSLWDVENNYRHTCYSGVSAVAQYLDTEENSGKKQQSPTYQMLFYMMFCKSNMTL